MTTPLNPYDLYDGDDLPFVQTFRDDDEEEYREYPIETDGLPEEVEVVYCKDCRWRGTEPEAYGGGCRWWPEEEPDDDDYCSWGERRHG